MKIDPGKGRRSRLLASVGCAVALALVLPGGVASAAVPAPPQARAVAVAPAGPSRAAVKAALKSERAAARFDRAAQRDHAVWQSHGSPTTLAIVRQTSIDLVDHGRLTQQIPRFGATLTIPVLARSLPRAWLTVTGDTARLSAAVALTPGVTLAAGAPVTKLVLDGGAAASDAASLYTGSGGLTLTGVTVSTVDHVSGQPLPPGPGRPFIFVSPNGRFTATDTTITNLGTAPPNTEGGSEDPNHPGVDFHPGSTGSLVRTTLTGSGTGLQLDGSRGVHLEDLTVTGSTGAGLVLHGDQGTTMSTVRADHNGSFGVRVTGPSTNRPITGVSATGNADFGVSIDKQTGLTISDVTTSANGAGGLELQESANVKVTGLTTTNESMGVLTHVNSTNVVLDHVTSTGGRRGVMVEKTTDKLTMSGSTITGASVAGVAVGGKNVDLHDMTVTDSRTGVRVERGAHAVTVTGVTLAGGLDGVVASPGTDGVVLQNLGVTDVSDTGVRSSSTNAQIVGGRIDGGATGIAVDAPTTISGTLIALADEGIRTQSPALVRADRVDVETVSVGINAAQGSPLLLTGTHVHALEAVRGTLDIQGANDISLPSLNLLGAIGVPLIILAVLLQMVAAFRGRRFGGDTRRAAPAPVTAAVTATAPAPQSEKPSPRHQPAHA